MNTTSESQRPAGQNVRRIVAVSLFVLAGAAIPVAATFSAGSRSTVSAAGAAMADQPGDPTVPPDVQAKKDEARRNAVEVPVSKEEGPPPVPRVDGDHGDRGAVESAKQAAQRLIVADCRLARLDLHDNQTSDERRAAARAAKDAVDREVPSVWASDQTSRVVDAVYSAADTFAEDPAYVGYNDCRLNLGKADGASVTGNSATVSFEGAVAVPARSFSFGTPATTPDGWEIPPTLLYNVALVDEGQGWRLEQVTTLTPDGNSPFG
jgi:hypothetical protein